MRKVAKLSDLDRYNKSGMGVTDLNGSAVRVVHAKSEPIVRAVPSMPAPQGPDHGPTIAALQSAVNGAQEAQEQTAGRVKLHGKAIRAVLATLDESMKPRKPREWTFNVERDTKGFLQSITAVCADNTAHKVKFEARRDSAGRIKKIVTSTQ